MDCHSFEKSSTGGGASGVVGGGRARRGNGWGRGHEVENMVDLVCKKPCELRGRKWGGSFNVGLQAALNSTCWLLFGHLDTRYSGHYRQSLSVASAVCSARRPEVWSGVVSHVVQQNINSRPVATGNQSSGHSAEQIALAPPHAPPPAPPPTNKTNKTSGLVWRLAGQGPREAPL